MITFMILVIIAILFSILFNHSHPNHELTNGISMSIGDKKLDEVEIDMLKNHANSFSKGQRVFICLQIKCNSVSLTPTYKRNVFDIILPEDTKGTVVGSDGIRLIISPDGLPFDIAIDPFMVMLVLEPEDGNP